MLRAFGGQSRRWGKALGTGALLTAGAAMTVGYSDAAAGPPSQGPFQLPPLPYPMNALEPKMSERTLSIHWGKHHAAYVTNLNNQIKDKAEWGNLTIEQAMIKAWNGGKPTPEFNNAGQVVNHTFFWESMKPNGGGQPKGRLLEAINRDFGSFDAFVQQFKTAGATQFGSGWAWLAVGRDGKLRVTRTPNAENPWVHGETPILTIDVWEHAYYLDFQNRRPDFISTFVDSLINWDKVEQRYEQATSARL